MLDFDESIKAHIFVWSIVVQANDCVKERTSYYSPPRHQILLQNEKPQNLQLVTNSSKQKKNPSNRQSFNQQQHQLHTCKCTKEHVLCSPPLLQRPPNPRSESRNRPRMYKKSCIVYSGKQSRPFNAQNRFVRRLFAIRTRKKKT